jgi:hypothetical protein
VFGSFGVFLITEPLACQNFNPLHFEKLAFIEYFVSPPRSTIKLARFRTVITQNIVSSFEVSSVAAT